MGDKYDEVLRRNRVRIFLTAAAGLINYWVAVLLFLVAVTVGTVVALILRGIVEGGDFALVWKAIRGIPHAVTWAVAAGWLTGGVTAWAVAGFAAIVTVSALVLMSGRLRSLERLVPRSGRRDPDVESLLEGVAIAAGVDAPPVVVLDDAAVNSCSVGRKPKDATVVVTRGLISALSRDELEAVLAYELSRVRSLDTAVSTWTAAITGRTIALSQETDRILVQLALVLPARRARRLRTRSFQRQAAQRDIVALSFTRHPEALLRALEKIARDETAVTAADTATAPLWLEWPWPDRSDAPDSGALDLRIRELRALVAA